MRSGRVLVLPSYLFCMDIDYNVSDVKQFSNNHGAVDIDVGWESLGSYKKAFIEVEFSSEVPDLDVFDDAENVEVEEWGENRVMFEVTLSTR